MNENNVHYYGEAHQKGSPNTILPWITLPKTQYQKRAYDHRGQE